MGDTIVLILTWAVFLIGAFLYIRMFQTAK